MNYLPTLSPRAGSTLVSCALGLRAANCQAANQENVGRRVVIERRRKTEHSIVRETKEEESEKVHIDANTPAGTMIKALISEEHALRGTEKDGARCGLLFPQWHTRQDHSHFYYESVACQIRLLGVFLSLYA